MRFMLHFCCVLLCTSAHALSLYNPSDTGTLSQKAVWRDNLGMGTTVREPIRMPSQTPMVPYKVREGSLLVDLHIFGFLIID